ncbi:MAG: ABC transporter substrate-binding protein, partial [Syntrophobacteraceae bacterium]
MRMVIALLVLCCNGIQHIDSATGAGVAESTAHEGKDHGRLIFRAPLLNNPPTLDPAQVKDIYGVTVIQQLYDGLVKFDADLFVTPALAESWRVEDGGKTYRFFLRKNALFHNGRLVDSKDVLFSLSRLLRVDPPPTILPHLLKIEGANDFHDHKAEAISGLQAVDDRTILIRLSEPYVPFIVALGMYQAKIVPREIVESDPIRFGMEPVGSGPFKFMSWEQNKVIRLQGFADYYEGKPRLDEIEFAIFPGISIDEVWTDFQSGKLDQMQVYGKNYERLKEKKDLQWVRRPSLSLQFYGFNCKHPLLANRDLRQALSNAIDREKLIAEAYSGQFQAAGGILSPGLPGYKPQGLRTGGEITKAEGVTEQSPGTERPEASIQIELVSNSQSPLAQAELEFVRKSWERVGIDLRIKYIPDWAQFKEHLRSDSLQIYRYAWFADIPDPDDILRPLFSSQSQFNYMRYENEEVDRMLQEALAIVDPVERATVYQRIEET